MTIQARKIVFNCKSIKHLERDIHNLPIKIIILTRYTYFANVICNYGVFRANAYVRTGNILDGKFFCLSTFTIFKPALENIFRMI